jgi:hypothetical protein
MVAKKCGAFKESRWRDTATKIRGRFSALVPFRFIAVSFVDVEVSLVRWDGWEDVLTDLGEVVVDGQVLRLLLEVGQHSMPSSHAWAWYQTRACLPLGCRYRDGCPEVEKNEIRGSTWALSHPVSMMWLRWHVITEGDLKEPLLGGGSGMYCIRSERTPHY